MSVTARNGSAKSSRNSGLKRRKKNSKLLARYQRTHSYQGDMEVDFDDPTSYSPRNLRTIIENGEDGISTNLEFMKQPVSPIYIHPEPNYKLHNHSIIIHEEPRYSFPNESIIISPEELREPMKEPVVITVPIKPEELAEKKPFQIGRRRKIEQVPLDTSGHSTIEHALQVGGVDGLIAILNDQYIAKQATERRLLLLFLLLGVAVAVYTLILFNWKIMLLAELLVFIVASLTFSGRNSQPDAYDYLSQVHDLRSVGSLVECLEIDDPDVQADVRETLIFFFNNLEPQHAHYLNHEQRGILSRHLTAILYYNVGEIDEFIGVTFTMLGVIGDDSFIPQMEQWARAEGAGILPHIRYAAIQTLPTLYASAQRLRNNPELLNKPVFDNGDNAGSQANQRGNQRNRDLVLAENRV